MHACLQLGRLHERGAGVPKDEVLAASIYKKSCDPDDKGSSGAGCVDLARVYEKGLGVPRNLAKATELLAFGCTRAQGAGSRLARAGEEAALSRPDLVPSIHLVTALLVPISA